MDPVWVTYDERLTRRGRLQNYVLNLFIEPLEVMQAKHRRFIEVEMASLRDEDVTFGWWAGRTWYHGVRLPLVLWRILLAQVKGNVLKLRTAMPWCYEKPLKRLYRLRVRGATTRVYMWRLSRRLKTSSRHMMERPVK